MDENSENGNKYHTLRSIDSKYNTLRNSESLFGSCWTSGNTLRMKNKLLRPTVLDELNAGDCDSNGKYYIIVSCIQYNEKETYFVQIYR